MAKTKEKEFKGLSLGRKKALNKTTIKPEEVERVAKEIHETKPAQTPKKKKPEPVMEVRTKKAGVTLEIGLFKKMKNRAIEKDMTISNYFKSLLIQDLEKAKK